jgi:hypothetical protein
MRDEGHVTLASDVLHQQQADSTCGGRSLEIEARS